MNNKCPNKQSQNDGNRNRLDILAQAAFGPDIFGSNACRFQFIMNALNIKVLSVRTAQVVWAIAYTDYFLLNYVDAIQGDSKSSLNTR